MPGFTPNRNYPFPLLTERVRVAGDIQALAEAIDLDVHGAQSPGDIKATIAAVAPPGWLLLNGDTVLNAQTLYPRLWAVAPSSWKSGANLALPDMTDAYLEGGGTRGAIGGSNTRTLTAAQLPAHVHTINPPETQTSIDNALDELHWAVTPGNFSISNVNGNASQGYYGPHRHTVNIPQFNSGSAGGGSPVDIRPRSLRVNWVVRT